LKPLKISSNAGLRLLATATVSDCAWEKEVKTLQNNNPNRQRLFFITSSL